MKKLIATNRWPLIRFIVPAYPAVNIYTGNRITPLGLVNVATSANTVWGWRVEIIDENNYRGPRGNNGLPDHEKLQAKNPATVTGFYCGLTSTMDRVYQLARFYGQQGVFNLAGGWHAHFCPEEALANGFDAVVHGEGEEVIRQILTALMAGNDLTAIAGISWRRDGTTMTNPPTRLELADLDDLPYPSFGLIRWAGKIKTYPLNRVRGCKMNCEFCSVKGTPRCANPEHVFKTIKWLVETRGAKQFFIVDDRLEEHRDGLLTLLELIKQEYGNRLVFTVQIRLETAKDTELLQAMSLAGVRIVCVGYESPIAEDLITMHKGLSPQKMIEWTLTLRRYFWVHGMFIFGYPNRELSALSVPEAVKRYKLFIRRAKISSIQVLHPVPLVGTELRARLEKARRIFPLEIVPWSRYDGSFACFQPDNMTLEQLQNAPFQIMKWFYTGWSFWRIPYRTLIFPIHCLLAGWRHWHYGWLSDIVKYGGHRLLKRWQNGSGNATFLAQLKSHAIGNSAARPNPGA